jgi:hypothetical protein
MAHSVFAGQGQTGRYQLVKLVAFGLKPVPFLGVVLKGSGSFATKQGARKVRARLGAHIGATDSGWLSLPGSNTRSQDQIHPPRS